MMPPIPPFAPPTVIKDDEVSANVLPDFRVTNPPGLATSEVESPFAEMIEVPARFKESLATNSIMPLICRTELA